MMDLPGMVPDEDLDCVTPDVFQPPKGYVPARKTSTPSTAAPSSFAATPDPQFQRATPELRCSSSASSWDGGFLPRIADTNGLDLSGWSEDDMLEALLQLTATEQGKILATWLRRLEKTGSHRSLQHQILRRIDAGEPNHTEVEVQTDVEMRTDFGDVTTDTLFFQIKDLAASVDSTRKALAEAAEQSNGGREHARQVQQANNQTVGQAEMCMTVCKVVAGHATRTETHMRENDRQTTLEKKPRVSILEPLEEQIGAELSRPKEQSAETKRASMLERKMTQDGWFTNELELAAYAAQVPDSSDEESEVGSRQGSKSSSRANSWGEGEGASPGRSPGK